MRRITATCLRIRRGRAMLCFQIVGCALTILFLAALVPTDRIES
jgi:hypothetical protein